MTPTTNRLKTNSNSLLHQRCIAPKYGPKQQRMSSRASRTHAGWKRNNGPLKRQSSRGAPAASGGLLSSVNQPRARDCLASTPLIHTVRLQCESFARKHTWSIQRTKNYAHPCQKRTRSPDPHLQVGDRVQPWPRLQIRPTLGQVRPTRH